MSFLGTALGQCSSSLAALQPRQARPAAPRSLQVRSVVAEAEAAAPEVPAGQVRRQASGAVAASTSSLAAACIAYWHACGKA